MTIRSLLFFSFLLQSCCSAFITDSYADAIYTDDGREIRGIIVEDYKDRVVISTVDGEVTALKADVRQLYYDSEADNLVKLAEQARERGDISRAFAYYEMAMRADPNSKAAKDGVVFLRGYILRKEEVKKEDEVRRREEFERYGAAQIPEDKSKEDELKEFSEAMTRKIGISLVSDDSGQVIDSIRAGSPAADAGVKKGDAIVAIWGRLTGYMPLEDVMKTLLDKPSLEIRLTIERDIIIRPDPNRNILSSASDVSGASFKMLFDGLTVSGLKDEGPGVQAGLEKNDIVVAVDGKSTRYMPIKKALSLIKNTRNDSLFLKIRRELSIWRKI
jgi:hypothetical protein